MRIKSRVLRGIILLATMSYVLVPALSAPARTITRPRTIAGSVALYQPGRQALSFLPTHISFSWTGSKGARIRYRTHDPLGTSRWIVAREDHDAARGDRRYSAVLEVDRPYDIDWRKVVPPAGYMTGVHLSYVNTLDGPRTTFRIPATADASASDPNIVTRAEWGADESLKHTTGGCTRRFYPVQQLFVHHTAGVNYDPHPYATMRAIYYFHVVDRGWCDIGYNFVISPDGTIFEGRWARHYQPWEIHSSENLHGYGVMGAQVEYFNSGSIGVSLMGNYTSIPASPPMRRSLAELLAWEADRHGLNPLGSHRYVNPSSHLRKKLPYIAGHRDAGETACPGAMVYAALPDIRRDVAAVMGAGKANTTTTLATSSPRVDYSASASLYGRLTDENGSGIVAAPVTIYEKPSGSSWVVGAQVTTGVDGSFGQTLSVARATRFQAVYDGDNGRWGSESNRVGVKVRALVSLSDAGGQPDNEGVEHFPQGTATVDFSGHVDPAHPRYTVYMKFARMGDDGVFVPFAKYPVRLNKRSDYAYTFAVPYPDSTYHVVTWFPADGDHLAAHSNPVTFTIDP